MVSAEATIFTKTVRSRTPRGLWCTAAIAASVPCPSASGATRKTRIAPNKRPRARDKWNRPRPSEVRRRHRPAFTRGFGDLIPGEDLEEEVGGEA